jgi:hypothetical protein
MDIRKLIDKLAAEEEDFLKSSFLAPVVRNGSVCVRIQGIVCKFNPEDREFEGWGIFKPISLKKVRLQEPAQRPLVRRYLDQLTSVALIAADPAGQPPTAILAHPAGSSVKFDGPIPVRMMAGVERFRHIIARFDGFNFWYDRIHPGRNPAQAAYLRKSLDKDWAVKKLDRPGLLPQEKQLYADLLKLERIRREAPDRRRIRQALQHAGATLESYYKRKKAYTVTFVLDGDRHTSRIRADDLTVLSAGICLSGEDKKFDLQSLVGVLREGRRFPGVEFD